MEEGFCNQDGTNLTIEELETAENLISKCVHRIVEINDGTFYPRLGRTTDFTTETSQRLNDAVSKLNESMDALNMVAKSNGK